MDCATNIKSCQEGDFPIKYVHPSSGQPAGRRYDSFRCSWLQDGHAFSFLINLSLIDSWSQDDISITYLVINIFTLL